MPKYLIYIICFLQSLLEYIKTLYIKLNTMNLQIPWIYIIQNKELLGRENDWQNPEFDANYKQKMTEQKAKEKEQAKAAKKKEKEMEKSMM